MSDFIQHVSDTSIWVAHYRATETEQPHGLFKDPYARELVGDKASRVNELDSLVTQWTRWTVVMRTVVIDQMIRDLISQGVTTFLNLGAGLDARPYRMDLPKKIQWIEIDYPKVIEYKQSTLKRFHPSCLLEQIGLDLADREARKKIFSDIALRYSKVCVITEGVLPYLTEDQVSELSEDLMGKSCFQFWIGEYISPKVYSYLQNSKRMDLLKNAPFRFYPKNWMGFFESRGWQLKEAKYHSEVGDEVGRPAPLPILVRVIQKVLGRKRTARFKKMSGFLLWSR